MAHQKRIAVIGAGPSGLVATKSCLEEGFLPVCYERNSDPGGLWRYHDEDIEGVASVMRTTIINTSKELGTFSDFPPPKEFPNFMHHTKMFDYFMMYAEHFNLLRHIRYNLEVVKVEQTEDFDQTGRWIVSLKSTQTNAVTKETFDAVMVCIGHHVFPNIPTFPNQEEFKGTIIHTHSLKSCDHFKGKKVVVVGIGNSGVDAAVDSTYNADQVYLSTRRGSWIRSRVGIHGRPYDMDLNNRLKMFWNSFRSFDDICTEIENDCSSKFDHAAYNLKPKHRVLSAHPTMNDCLPNAILSGRVIVKGNIDRFVENGVIFCNEDDVTEVDVVVLATGYQLKFPFLDSKVLEIRDNRVHLYKYCIPPHLQHSTLGIIALTQPLGPIFPVSEMQSRWFVQIQASNLKLPSQQEMENDILAKNEANAKRYVNTARHTIQVELTPFLDELADMIGVKPNFIKMAIIDPILFWHCITRPILPYQYRLVGPHSWKGARRAILEYEDRVYLPLNKNSIKIPVKPYEKKGKLLTKQKLIYFLSIIVTLLVVNKKYKVLASIKNYLQLLPILFEILRNAM